MKNGFIITELRLTANNLPPAKVSFQKGLNVITGPTNTGKSYIFQCINYMLGSSSNPKDIKEARSYSNIFLEICNYKNEYYTLESDFKGGNFKLFKTKIDNIDGADYEVLNRKHDPFKENTVSSFLLSQSNIWGKKIRLNAKGKTRSISYRDIVHFLMVNEERIITEESPIVTHYTKATEELNTLKFIVTGIDDGSVIEAISKNEIHNRKGKVDLLNELIEETKEQLVGRDDLEQIETSILKITKGIDYLNVEYQNLNKQFSLLESEREGFNADLQDKKSRQKVLKELLTRSNLLKEQYDNDIRRLRATIEASVLLSGNHTMDKNCPLCNNIINEKCNEEEIAKIINSCNNEILKIDGLKKELIETVELMNTEVTQLTTEVSLIEIKVQRLSLDIKTGVGKQLEQILKSIIVFNDKKSQLIGIMALYNQYNNYKKQKEALESSIPKSNENPKFGTLSTASLSDLSEKIKSVLEECNYPKISEVSYSEERNDFVISGEDRSLSGKGFRAITYSAYIVGLQELIASKDYSIGVPILDSPLVTYRKPKAGDEAIPVDLAMDFYRYLSRKNEISQFIIIENEEPPMDILDNIKHITFSGIEGEDRYGFIPINTSR
ncbi:MAG: hypothetical protein Q8928_05590 [Bacteroidota bacterium]|nr:hypothetical protein [Bacteroidota bacterium]